MPPLSPPLDQRTFPISPELALVDRELAELARGPHPAASAAQEAVVELPDHDAREAMLRMCELSDVNPPPARRRLLTVAVPAALWAEVLMVVASLVPFGTP